MNRKKRIWCFFDRAS